MEGAPALLDRRVQEEIREMSGVGFDIRDDQLKISVRINVYPNRKQMMCAFGGRMSQRAQAGYGPCTTARPNLAKEQKRFVVARINCDHMSFRGVAGYRVANVLLSARQLRHGEAEHEFFHAVYDLARVCRREKRLRAKGMRGSRQIDAWWEEWQATAFSNVLTIWRLWLKYGREVDKIPQRLVPGTVFPREL